MSDMEMCISRKSEPPYGGQWELNRPDLGLVGKGYIFDVLVDRCRKWRVANGVPIGLGFAAEVERECCRQKPDHCQPCNVKLHPRRLTFQDLLTGTSSMLSFMAAGSPLVSAAEAERRAGICAKCPFNVEYSTPCGGICSSLKNLVKSIIGNAATSRDADLRSCYICGCFLRSSVWVPVDLQLKPLSEKQRQTLAAVPHCWKKL